MSIVKNKRDLTLKEAIMDHLYKRGMSIIASSLPTVKVKPYAGKLKTTSAVTIQSKTNFSVRHLRAIHNLDIIILPKKTVITNAKWDNEPIVADSY